MPESPARYIVHIWCHCGHEGPAGLDHWVHRDEVLRRARCTVCGRKGAKTMIVPTEFPKMGCDPAADLEALRRERGW
uniref:hypothetical protein n=1 Tax=Paracoccus sp. TRP TaxID=412597 RepID=UPI0002F7C432|nr:hypothetical protein [Paracoccus sp. TRP]